ncbi:MAG: hypothetical protein JXD22_09495 [Sedimentisphaerales bacterium]|nr:hypothetical protein [Sedimentisphaerales bacterium]
MSFALKIADLADRNTVLKMLLAGGLSSPAADAKADLFVQSAQALLQAGRRNDHPACAFFVPGRIEVLGKHTDYNGGRSVVATAEKGFCLVAAPRTDAQVNITAPAMNEKSEFEIDTELTPTMGHWSNYPMTVVRRLARNFPGKLCGADVAFNSDLPPAAGMSSSSAMMISFFLALNKVNQLDEREEYTNNIDSKESLAGYLGTCENGQNFGTLLGDKGVGTFGGSEDHTAILCAQPNKLSQYSYCPVNFERFIEVPTGYIFAIAGSGVAAEKTGAAREKYNRASLLGSAVVKNWNQATHRNDSHIAAALASGPDALTKMREILKNANHNEFTAQEISTRFEHFYAESGEIIPAAGDALNAANDSLSAANIEEFGRQVDRSQELTDTQLGNQVPETIFLAQTARKIGAVAASAFGAGFGGSVWALVTTDQAKNFLQNWAKQYQKAYPTEFSQQTFFLTHPGPATFELT